MKKMSNIFTAAIPGLLKEYPLVFLTIIVAALWLYSLGTFCIFAVHTGGVVYASESVPVGEDEELASLRDGLGLYQQSVAGRERLFKLAEASKGSPFHISVKINRETAKYLPEQAPPSLYVRAVAIGAKARTALIDFAGEGGRLVRENEPLLSGAGKVVRINSEGVAWTWNSQELFSPLKE